MVYPVSNMTRSKQFQPVRINQKHMQSNSFSRSSSSQGFASNTILNLNNDIAAQLNDDKGTEHTPSKRRLHKDSNPYEERLNLDMKHN